MMNGDSCFDGNCDTPVDRHADGDGNFDLARALSRVGPIERAPEDEGDSHGIFVKTPTVKFQKIHPDAKIPTRGTDRAAGMDLYALESVCLQPGKWNAVTTGLNIELPAGYEGQVRPRSGLAAKYGVTVLNSPGTIDDDYRGELKVVLINHAELPYRIMAGDRIGQLVVKRVELLEPEEVAELSDTARGSKGFGSTGR
jgi:dUTP pyrophosphatase